MARDGEIIPPTPERIAKGDLQAIATDRGGLETRSFAYPFDAYVNHGHVTRRQFNAGNRFAAMWRASTASSHVSQVRYEEPSGGSSPEYMYFLGPELKEALDSVRGNAERKVLFEVCCEGRRAGKGMKADIGGPMRRLCSALDDLAAHFRALDDIRHQSL